MSENRNAADAGSRANTPRGCELAEEFVTYLYGEATPEESKVFRQHLGACAVCRDELAALGGVREAFGVWRAEALSSLPSLDLSHALTPSVFTPQATGQQRSASAALREFFTLAPLWLRAGAFAATLALCALSALTLSRAEVSWDANGLAFRTGVPERIFKEPVPATAQPTQKLYTEKEVDIIVAQNVVEVTTNLQRELERRQQQLESIVNATDRDDKPRPQSANAPRRKRAARPDARRDEPLLAEDNLPRLSDLLDGSY